MLVLQPKVDEWIILRNERTGGTVARLKMFLSEGRSRLAFDIPKEIQVTRKPLEQGSAKNARHSSNKAE